MTGEWNQLGSVARKSILSKLKCYRASLSSQPRRVTFNDKSELSPSKKMELNDGRIDRLIDLISAIWFDSNRYIQLFKFKPTYFIWLIFAILMYFLLI